MTDYAELQFTDDHLDPPYDAAGQGDHFQTFVREILECEPQNYANFNQYAAAGKDGGIDLRFDIPATPLRGAVECKCLSKDTATNAWTEVAKKFARLLANPNGPPPGQSQYEPWFDTARPIRRYVFCVSSTFINDAGNNRLRQEITTFFNDLIARHPHLSHLQGINVTVVGWNELLPKLQAQPHIAFRWFKTIRPNGFTRLDDDISRANGIPTFHDYLTERGLPYFSMKAAQDQIGAPPSDVRDEDQLLARLGESGPLGYLISAQGGMGKTRLMLELGRMALRQGWVVVKSRKSLTPADIHALASRLKPDHKTLVLIDYVETQDDFVGIVDEVDEVCASSGLHIRLIASCRSSYAPTLSGILQIEPLDLSPIDPTSKNWFAQYRDLAVRHILDGTCVGDDPTHREMCHGLPVLAAFMGYVKQRHGDDDLRQLIGEQDFGRWILKRLSTLLPNIGDDKPARLMAMMPMADTAWTKLYNSNEGYQGLMDALANDGWIDNGILDGGLPGKVTAHDVMADQVLLLNAKSKARTLNPFLDGLCEQAHGLDTLHSLLVTLQRVGMQEPFNGFDWHAFFDGQLRTQSQRWMPLRNRIFRFSAMDITEQLELLTDHPAFWVGVETEHPFIGYIGWILRHTVKLHRDTLVAKHLSTLREWTARCLAHLGRSTFLLDWGLRLFPDSEPLRQAALKNLAARPHDPMACFLFAAWLDACLPPDAIRPAFGEWLKHNALHPNLTYIVQPWLKVVADTAFVQPYIRSWLDVHGDIPQTQFLLRSWLVVSEDFAFIRRDLRKWLDKQGQIPEAGFVLTDWLNVSKDFAFVHNEVRVWLNGNKHTLGAGYVLTAWLTASTEFESVRGDVRVWLTAHGQTPGAGFVLASWLDAGGDLALVRDDVNSWLTAHNQTIEAQYVLTAWLEAAHGPEEFATFFYDWLHRFRDHEHATYVNKIIQYDNHIPAQGACDVLYWCCAYPHHLDAPSRLNKLIKVLFPSPIESKAMGTVDACIYAHTTSQQPLQPVTVDGLTFLVWGLVNVVSRHGYRNWVDHLFLIWLRHPDTIGPATPTDTPLRPIVFLLRFISLAKAGQIDPVADRAAIMRFCDWVARLEPHPDSETEALQLPGAFQFVRDFLDQT